MPTKVPTKPRVGCAGMIGQDSARKSACEGVGTEGTCEGTRGQSAWGSALEACVLEAYARAPANVPVKPFQGGRARLAGEMLARALVEADTHVLGKQPWGVPKVVRVEGARLCTW